MHRGCNSWRSQFMPVRAIHCVVPLKKGKTQKITLREVLLVTLRDVLQ